MQQMFPPHFIIIYVIKSHIDISWNAIWFS